MNKSFVCTLLSLLYITTVDAQNLASIVSNVDTAWVSGAIGTMFPTANNAVPVVAADPNTATFPSIFGLAATAGSGKVIGFGHDGLTNNSTLLNFDNVQLVLNAFNWLDASNTNLVKMASGHGEFVNYNNATTLRAQLMANGYTVSNLPGVITATSLSGVGVLYIGNAWGSYSAAELLVLQNYVQGGGSLFLLGLGWSWDAYNTGGINAYPMNQIGNFCGVHWSTTNISDATNTYNGSPLLLSFYPATQSLSVSGACDIISNITATYPNNLPATLQNNSSIRTQYFNAHLFMKEATLSLDANNPLRQDIYNCYNTLIDSYPIYFRKGTVYNTTTENNMAWIRERIQRNLADALPLTPALKTEIATTLNLTGRYLDIWNGYTVLLADNSRLDTPQKEYLYKLYTQIPATMQNLRLMSFADYLGTPPIASSGAIPNFLTGQNTSINSFNNVIGTCPENQFPSDVSPGVIDCFGSAAAHEVNHIVDYYYIANNPTLLARKNALIAQAGTNHLNYLRSMLPDGFFSGSPQEFIASIANQWFANSKHVLDLAITRFDAGRSEPLNQFLFFAELYSQGNSNTLFYTNTPNCDLSSEYIGVGRDANQRITRLCVNNNIYTFTLDANGNATNYSVVPLSVAINGNTSVCNTNTVNYSVALPFPNATYTWTATGGNIISGQGSDNVYVQWGNDIAGTLNVVMIAP